MMPRPGRFAGVSMAIGFSPLAATKFPTGGHQMSPLVAIRCPHWWPSNLPTGGGFRGSGQRPHPFPGGCLGEPIAVLPVGDQDVRVVQ
jgi:hypothetical protein